MPGKMDPGYITMMFLVLLGFLVMLGTFVLGPLVTMFK